MNMLKKFSFFRDGNVKNCLMAQAFLRLKHLFNTVFTEIMYNCLVELKSVMNKLVFNTYLCYTYKRYQTGELLWMLMRNKLKIK